MNFVSTSDDGRRAFEVLRANLASISWGKCHNKESGKSRGYQNLAAGFQSAYYFDGTNINFGSMGTVWY